MRKWKGREETNPAMTSQREALIAAIRAAPDEDDRRLVAADWFEEQGDESSVARAAFIRTQVERAKLPPEDARQSELQALELRLLKRHGSAWCGSHFLFRKVRFRRGFVEYVHLHLRHFLHHRRQLLALEPIRDVRLTGWFRAPSDLVRRVAGCKELQDVQTLRIHHQGPHKSPGNDLLILLESPHLTHLRALHVPMLSLDADARRRFERLPLLRNVEELNLPYLETYPHSPGMWLSDGVPTSDEWANLRSLTLPYYLNLDLLRRLSAASFWDRLTALEIVLPYDTREALQVLGDRLPKGLRALRLFSGHSPVDYTGATSFFDRIAQLPLERLHLSLDPLRVTTLQRLLGGKSQWRLREFGLAGCGLTEEHAAVLAGSRALNEVWSLSLQGNWELKGAAIRTLASSGELPKLTHLDLSGGRLGKAGVIALARANRWGSLRSLNLWSQDTGEGSLQTLLASPVCRNLTWLSLSDSSLKATLKVAFPPHLASLRLACWRSTARGRQKLAEALPQAWVSIISGQAVWTDRDFAAPERWPPVDEAWDWGHVGPR